MIRISFEEPSCILWTDWRDANQALSRQHIEELTSSNRPTAQRKSHDLINTIWAWKNAGQEIDPNSYQEMKSVLEWEVWKLQGLRATEAAIKAVADGTRPKVDEELYKRMKPALMAASNGKCAYCESKIGGVDQPGDVEHFRPKGRVINEDGKPVVITQNGKAVPHPGYYWLTYDWKNLLIACKSCNSPTRDESGLIRGKWDRFPLQSKDAAKPPYRASNPGEEKEEYPLFLNPALQDPDDHFVFDEKTGLLGCKTPEATSCEKWLHLNRDGLIEQRRDTYDNVVGRTNKVLNAAMIGAKDELQAALEFLSAYRCGVKPYAFAGRKALLDSKNSLKDVFAFFR